MSEELYTVAQVAVIRKKKVATIRAWCRDGKLVGATPDPSGSWMIPQSALDKLEGKEVALEDTGDSVEVRQANERAEIADAQSRESKANAERDAYKVGKTVDEYIKAQTNLERREANIEYMVEEKLTPYRDALVAKSNEYEAGSNKYRDKLQQLQPVIDALKNDVAELRAENKRIIKLFGGDKKVTAKLSADDKRLAIEEQEARQLEYDDLNYPHMNDIPAGIAIISGVISQLGKLGSWGKHTSGYLSKQHEWLLRNSDITTKDGKDKVRNNYKNILLCFRQCNDFIVLKCSQIEDSKRKDFDAIEVFNWLLTQTGRIEEILGTFNGVDNERHYDSPEFRHLEYQGRRN